MKSNHLNCKLADIDVGSILTSAAMADYDAVLVELPRQILICLTKGICQQLVQDDEIWLGEEKVYQWWGRDDALIFKLVPSILKNSQKEELGSFEPALHGWRWTLIENDGSPSRLESAQEEVSAVLKAVEEKYTTTRKINYFFW